MLLDLPHLLAKVELRVSSMREFSIRFHEDAIGSPHGFALLEALPIPEFPAFPSRPSREPEPLEPLGLCDDREFEKLVDKSHRDRLERCQNAQERGNALKNRRHRGRARRAAVDQARKAVSGTTRWHCSLPLARAAGCFGSRPRCAETLTQ